MTFIKSLKINKSKKGQASLEYFVIFSVVALLVILSFSSFLPAIQRALQGGYVTTTQQHREHGWRRYHSQHQQTTLKQGFFQKAIGTSGLNVANK